MRLRDSLLPLLAILAFSGSAQAATGFTATLNSAQEVPVNASTATGTSTCVLNNAGTQVTVFVQFAGLGSNYSASHIHGFSAPGVNSGVRFGFSPTLSNGNRDGVFNGTWNLTATDATNLGNGLCYVNIHSSGFPGGEIRGQLTNNVTSNDKSTWGRLKKLYR